MHTAWHRVNAVFTYFATIAAAMCALTALVDVLVSPSTTTPSGGGGGGDPPAPPWPPAALAVREVKRLAPLRGKHDQALLGGISLDADLRRAFNWNTKQLFVTLRAEYETPANALNQVRGGGEERRRERESASEERSSLARCSFVSRLPLSLFLSLPSLCTRHRIQPQRKLPQRNTSRTQPPKNHIQNL
jgi:hypothetical protein